MFLFRSVEAVEIKHLGRVGAAGEELGKETFSLLLRGGGSCAGEEQAWTGERVAKKLSAFSPLCHLPC